MEAIFVPASPDQSLYPNTQIRNPRKTNRPLISRPSENISGGVLHAPPPSLALSFPPSAAPPLNALHRHHHHNRHQTQESLLPLPLSNPYQKIPPRRRGLSCTPPSKKINRSRSQSLTPDKSKPSTTTRRSDLKSIATEAANFVTECSAVETIERLGPDPNDLPKNVSGVLSSLPLGNNVGNVEGFEMFSGSASVLSPPPSSLPLPKFSARPKLTRCKVEAAGIDAGATDNLRRLLRLR